MNCSRCQGLMVEDQFLDLEGGYGEMWTTSLRCLNCGHVHDSVIEQNRLLQQAKVLVLSTGGPDYQEDEGSLEAESFISLAA